MDISAQFIHKFDCPPTHISIAPGHVNLIGEHVDYNDGPVLPAAIDRTVKIAAAGSADNTVHLHASTWKSGLPSAWLHLRIKKT